MAIINPDNAANKSVKWISSNPSVASIDQNGNLSTLSNGNTIITVETDDGKYKASCNVTVSSLDKLVTVIARGKNIQQTTSGFNIILHSRLINPTSKPIQILSTLLINPFGTILQIQPGGSTIVENGSNYNSFNLFFEVQYDLDAFFQTLSMYKVIYQFVADDKYYQVEQFFDGRTWVSDLPHLVP